MEGSYNEKNKFEKGWKYIMQKENYLKGMLMIILSAFCFACMNVCVRLAGDIPSVQKSFFRNLVAAAFAAVVLGKNRICPFVFLVYWGGLGVGCIFGMF